MLRSDVDSKKLGTVKTYSFPLTPIILLLYRVNGPPQWLFVSSGRSSGFATGLGYVTIVPPPLSSAALVPIIRVMINVATIQLHTSTLNFNVDDLPSYRPYSYMPCQGIWVHSTSRRAFSKMTSLIPKSKTLHMLTLSTCLLCCNIERWSENLSFIGYPGLSAQHPAKMCIPK